MIAALDVAYDDATRRFVAAGVAFEHWTSDTSIQEAVVPGIVEEPYRSGELYRRELPALLAVLKEFRIPPDILVVDGYVWLGDETRPGLGGHLFNALVGAASVVGVAKNPLPIGRPSRAVLRGASHRPLFVSTAGMDLDDAAHGIAMMHGHFRIPTLLRKADKLGRSTISSLRWVDGTSSGG